MSCRCGPMGEAVDHHDELLEAKRQVEALQERVKDLEWSIVVSHKTGTFGPIEDAYSAGGHPCLRHRPGVEEVAKAQREMSAKRIDECVARMDPDDFFRRHIGGLSASVARAAPLVTEETS